VISILKIVGFDRILRREYGLARAEYAGHLRELDRLIELAGNTQYGKDLREEYEDYIRDTKIDIEEPYKAWQNGNGGVNDLQRIVNDMRVTNDEMFKFLHTVREKLNTFRKSKGDHTNAGRYSPFFVRKKELAFPSGKRGGHKKNHRCTCKKS
jgi:hypothetical protein